jgi:hypothetical protein
MFFFNKQNNKTFAKGGKISRAKKQYNKDVDAYKWFVVNIKAQKTESGWEYKQDAIDALTDYDGDNNYKVVNEKTLIKMGIENPKEKWKKSSYADGGNVLFNEETIGEITFDDQTDMRHGYYTFEFETTDAEGDAMFDYTGSITLAPANSRQDDEVEWDDNTPEDWETAQEYVIEKFYEWKNKKYADGGEVSYTDIMNEKRDNKLTIFDDNINYDTRKVTNRADKKIPQRLVSEIEGSGVTIEQLEKIDVPIFKYKTQITIHGIFDGLTNEYAGGYKSLIVNQNKSLGVRYVAIDAPKKNKIMAVIQTMKLLGEKPKWHVERDSTGFGVYMVKPVTAETLNSVRDEMKRVFDSIPDVYVGDKYVYMQRTMWGVQSIVFIRLNAIYQKNLWKFIDFITDGYVKNEDDYNTLVDKYEQKVKAENDVRKAEDEAKRERLKEILQKVYYPQKEKLIETSPYPLLTALPDKSYFDKNSIFKYAAIQPDENNNAIIEVREIEKKKQWFYEEKYNNVSSWDDVQKGNLEKQTRYGKTPTIDYERKQKSVIKALEGKVVYFDLNKAQSKPEPIKPIVKPQPASPAPTNVSSADVDLNLVKYSEKAVAVFGTSTYAFRKSLGEVGGTFNKYLTNPNTNEREAGWIYAAYKQPQLQKLVEDAKAGILKFDEGGSVPSLAPIKKGSSVIISHTNKKLYSGTVIGMGESEIGVDSGIKIVTDDDKKHIVFLSDIVWVFGENKKVIASSKMDTPDGKIDGTIEWNPMWNKIQVYIDGAIEGEFDNLSDAVYLLEGAGFKNIEYQK